MITIEWLYGVIGLLVGVIMAWGITALFYHRGLSKKAKELEESRVRTENEAKSIISEAVRKGENRKRELLLSMKEEIQNARHTLECDVREKRQEMTRERQRLEQKESTLDRRIQSLEDRERNFKERESALDEKVELNAVEIKKMAELERVAGLSRRCGARS